MIVRASALVALLSFPAAGEETLPEPLRAHAECAAAGRESAGCAEILTGYCLEGANDLRELTACRAALAKRMEDEAVRLAARLGDLGEEARAAALIAGAERVVAEFCAGLVGRAATTGSTDHDARCALMRAHVEVYHLRRALVETEHET